MREPKFKIGDRVVTELGYGNVTDLMYSARKDEYTYEVCCDNLTDLFKEDELDIAEKKGYSMDIKIDIASNVVIATLYEESEDTMTPLAKGHGHMIHQGKLGVAQAASYACKKLYESLGGEITKGGSWR